ncbi:MAG: nucleoside kinase [Mogibacterium sp.]|nr:nucleoside kinase [Mogibacterium sp.]
MKIELCLHDDTKYTEVEVKKGTTLEELYLQYRDQLPYDCFVALVNNIVRPLSDPINKKCKVRFLDNRSKHGALAYQSSLGMLFVKAMHDTIGSRQTEVLASLNDGIYIQVVQGELTEDEVAIIGKQMRKLVKDDLTIQATEIRRDEFDQLMEESGMPERARVVTSLPPDTPVRVYTLDDISVFSYTFMVPSTRYLNLFAIMRYRDGVLLRFPDKDDPDMLEPFVDEYILYRACKEQYEWNRLLGIRYLADINEVVLHGDVALMVQLSEALHDQKVVEIADEIIERKKRIILIVGPSSSGKTTFARRLAIQLMVNGLHPLYLSTDDYFLERDQTSKDADGKPDFENVTALDVPLFNQQIPALLNGEEVDIPVFNFLTGSKEFGKRITRLDAGEPIIIEGIHAFNPQLTGELSDEDKYKIYISPLTQINLDAYNRISATDTRLLRRMVRDSRTRGYDAAQTLRIWPSVRNGESINIFPYSSDADTFFNTVHIFEMNVLKKYAVPLLKKVPKDDPIYPEANRLLWQLMFVDEMQDESVISGNSILREFIGGSVYK